MLNKKILIAVCAIVALIVGIIILNVSTEIEQSAEENGIQIQEIQPEEEIPEENSYETNVTLFFPDASSGVMSKENRTIDARELIDNPYLYVMNLLIKGPENKGLINPIPEDTKVNSAVFNKETLNIDLSKEFLKGSGTDPVYSIVDTMSNFNEVKNIKITIDGEEKEGLKEKYVRIKE